MFSNTTAELSLNTPSKCITSIPNDPNNHRFLVGTCSLSPSSSSSSNSLYLLRYHEEMNELAVDAQLEFSNDENKNYIHNSPTTMSSAGEIWSMSSCPFDKTLLVVCRDNGVDGTIETALWRIPENAFKEDEIDYYPEDSAAANDGGGMGGSAIATGLGGMGSVGSMGGSLSRNFSDANESLEKLDILNHTSHDDTVSTNILNGRVSDMKWNPLCLPQFDDVDGEEGGGMNASFGSTTASGSISGSTVSGVNFLTVNYTTNGNPTIYTWDIHESSSTLVKQISIPSSISSSSTKVPSAPKLSWDPHNTNLCAVTSGLNVAIVDFRDGHVVSGMKHCHKFGITDIDYNPNTPNILSTCGQDGLIKFWDLRYSSTNVTTTTTASTNMMMMTRQQPLRILRGGHTHWTTKVKYNTCHDQLLLSGGTDGMVNLWRISSISSAPLLDLGSSGNNNFNPEKDFQLSSTLSGFDDDDDEDKYGRDNNDNDDDDLMFSTTGGGDGSGMIKNETSFSDETDGGNAPDVRVTKMEMREAVYDLDWSAADPWVYVTLGFDGNVVLNHVPSKEKYKILL